MADQNLENEKKEDLPQETNKIDPLKSTIKVKRGEYQVHIYLEEARGLVPNKEG